MLLVLSFLLSALLLYLMFRGLSFRRCCCASARPAKRRGSALQPKPEPRSDKIKLVIYDFDRTLSSVHVWNATQGSRGSTLNEVSDEDLVAFFESAERVVRLKAHLKLLKAKKIEFRILSHGWEDVIWGCFERLEKLGLMEKGLIKLDDIVGRELLANFRNQKQLCIQQWIKELGYSPEQVIFVDDDPFNIDAVASSMTCATYHVEGCGLTAADLNHLESRF